MKLDAANKYSFKNFDLKEIMKKIGKEILVSMLMVCIKNGENTSCPPLAYVNSRTESHSPCTRVSVAPLLFFTSAVTRCSFPP